MALDRGDIFTRPVPNRRDWLYYLTFFILIGLIFFFNFIQSDSIKSYGAIYTPLFLFTFSLVGIAILGKGIYTGEVLFGKRVNLTGLAIDMLWGAFYGGLIIYFYAHISSAFGLQLPFAVSSSSLNGVPPLLFLVLVGVFFPEMEESLRASTLVPTFAKFQLPIIFLVAGLISVGFGTSYFIVTLAFFILAVISLYPPIRRKVANSPFNRHLIGIITAEIIFGLFHIYAYNGSNLIQLVISAAVFGFFADVINWYRQSAIPSRIAHSINNSFITAIVLGIDLRLAVFVVAIYAAIITILFITGKMRMTVGGFGVGANA